MEKEMFVGKETFFFPQGTFFITKDEREQHLPINQYKLPFGVLYSII